MVWKVSMNLVSMFFLLVGSIYSMVMCLYMLMLGKCYMIEWEIMSMNSSTVVVSYIFDWMSLMFMGVVMLISSMVLFYSGEYMGGDININRFIYLVLAFVGSMVILIISPNLISILLGWDGLGLVSYALVIYYQNEKSANAGMLTVLSNRVGDVAILLSIGLMLSIGSWNFFVNCNYLSDEVDLTMKFFIVLAAMTKSAQIPFSAWLPAAMAAPTPVSALVHSSTLVTAGVYLMIRFSPALMNSNVQVFLLLISCLTMFMSGLGANFEYDLKKIIALSTLSQLGVMLSAVSMGLSCLAFFHLLTHALFKALLFMCAGVIIHNVKEFQDIRYMGSLSKFMPFTSMMMNLSNLALCGSPFLAGFYSKDLILEVAMMSWINVVSFLLYVVATSLTVCYTFRLVYYSLSGSFNLSSYSSIGDESVVMTNSMVLLSGGAIVGGAVLSWLILPDMYMICMSSMMKSVVLMVSGLGGVLGYMLNMMSLNGNLSCLSFYNMSVFMGSMWNMPFLSTYNMSKISYQSGGDYIILADKGWSECLGGQGMYEELMDKSVFMNILQDNSVKIFMKIFLMSLVLVFLV
uniref:NADH dehydrogenase subunit 5 n=1 Tax=Allogalathea elegans TaxID=541025 RepID=UPI002182462C|nr:NADH dehydrogenase subunit 5 [Allogalathea elegans]UVF62811.1 NADH dehydrogenase subunit 5 [Allogalathea elegans]